MAAVGRAAEGDRGVVVLAVVHPVNILGAAFRHKATAVEVSDEILRSRTAVGAAVADVDDEQPFALAGASDLPAHHVGAFPDAAVRAVALAEAACLPPVEQILGGVEAHLLAGGEHEAPAAALLVAEHLGIAKVGHIARDDGIAGVAREGHAPVAAHGHALCLALARGGVEGQHRARAVARDISAVHDTRTAEDCAQRIGPESDGLLLPVDEIAAHGMAPRHILPERAVGIVLIIEMPFAAGVEHAVRVIHPSVERCMVIERAKAFAIGCIKGVGVLEQLPEGDVRECLDIASAAGDVEVEQRVLALPGGELERHIIVSLCGGEAHIERLLGAASHDDGEAVVVRPLLHGQQEILVRGVEAEHGVIAAQDGRRYLVAPRAARHEGKQQDECSLCY